MNINEKANNDLRVSEEWYDTTYSYWDGRDYKKHMQYQRVKSTGYVFESSRISLTSYSKRSDLLYP